MVALEEKLDESYRDYEFFQRSNPLKGLLHTMQSLYLYSEDIVVFHELCSIFSHGSHLHGPEGGIILSSPIISDCFSSAGRQRQPSMAVRQERSEVQKTHAQTKAHACFSNSDAHTLNDTSNNAHKERNHRGILSYFYS